MENVVRQLKQYKFDCVMGKKKHYNASSRKRGYYNTIIISQIVISAIASTSLLVVVFGAESKATEIGALLFSIAVTVLAGVQKSCNFEVQAQGNTKAADMYLSISKKIGLIINCIKDGGMTNSEILEKVNEIRSEIDQANELASQFPTSDNDYKKAKAGIQNGEEDYTKEELELWE